MSAKSELELRRIREAVRDIHIVVSSQEIVKSDEVRAAEIQSTGLIVAAMVKKGL